MRMIIADDERPARFMLKSMLAEAGFSEAEMSEACDGRELVDLAAASKPRLGFVDIRMPGMDGLEAIARCKVISPDTVWVIVSSFAEFEYARSAIRLGVTEYLVKPVSPEDLARCLTGLGLSPESPRNDPILGPLLEHVDRNFNADVSISDLADMSGLTPNYLSSLFHLRLGMTFSAYLGKIRMEHARRLLREKGLSVAEAARAVGYSDVRHFSRKYREVTGEYPSDSRG